jgi:uncharacterized membrane protein YfcA
MMIPQEAAADLGNAKRILLLTMALFGVFYVVSLIIGLNRIRRARQSEGAGTVKPTLGGLAVGFVTNFFDTLGIGSYATTTSMFRFWKMVPDERIPGTLNVGHTLPTLIEAYLFMTAVKVDARTLILMIASSVVGAWLGASVVAGWPRRKVQIGMGLCLIGFAVVLLLMVFNLMPGGGTSIELTGTKLWIGVAGNLALGALMTLGIGLYAPCLILVSLLGMDPIAGFPIMMGSCAFLMPVASARFIQRTAFDPRAILGLMIGGIPAVLIAFYIVKSLPLTPLRWLVIAVVIYTSVTLLRSAKRERMLKGLDPHG